MKKKTMNKLIPKVTLLRSNLFETDNLCAYVKIFQKRKL